MTKLVIASLGMFLACVRPPQDAPEVVTLPTPSASASVTAPSATPLKPEAAVRASIPRWLDLLARDADEAFLDEVIMPEQLDKILGNLTRAQLVEQFRNDKHKELVKMLKAVLRTTPASVTADGARFRVLYEGVGGHITFVVDDGHVFIKD